MAEIDKNNQDIEEPIEEQEVNIEIEEPGAEVEEEVVEEDFYANLAKDMDERVLTRISNQLITDYKKDKVSRADWEQTYTQGLDLLGFKYQDQTRPFQGATGVTHPLLAESVTQFQAQAYKELLPPSGPVRAQVVGATNKQIDEQAKRVEDFMNYMIVDEMQEYTPDFDQMLFYLPLSGSTFKKVYFDEIMQRAVSKFVPAEDIVVPYYASDLSDCERITHLIKMSKNEVLKKQKAEIYLDIDLKVRRPDESELEQKIREIDG